MLSFGAGKSLYIKATLLVKGKQGIPVGEQSVWGVFFGAEGMGNVQGGGRKLRSPLKSTILGGVQGVQGDQDAQGPWVTFEEKGGMQNKQTNKYKEAAHALPHLPLHPLHIPDGNIQKRAWGLHQMPFQSRFCSWSMTRRNVLPMLIHSNTHTRTGARLNLGSRWLRADPFPCAPMAVYTDFPASAENMGLGQPEYEPAAEG